MTACSILLALEPLPTPLLDPLTAMDPLTGRAPIADAAEANVANEVAECSVLDSLLEVVLWPVPLELDVELDVVVGWSLRYGDKLKLVYHTILTS